MSEKESSTPAPTAAPAPVPAQEPGRIPAEVPAGTATGIGSHPDEDPGIALRVVFDELPDLPYLPELPTRGIGADLLGRTAALLVDMPVEVQPSGWRLTGRPGRDLRRAREFLAQDLDALEVRAAGYAGALKLQAAGPWTLAAGLELPYGDKALADPGAVRDLAASLAEGLSAHVDEIVRRVPGARVVLQLDEPSLPGALTGTTRTASGFGTLPAVEPPVAEATLRAVLTATASRAVPLVHCCARHVPVALLRAAGARAISLDLHAADVAATAEPLAEAIEAGVGLFAGIVPVTGTDRDLSDPRATVRPVRDLWSRLGLDRHRLPGIVVTPSCGLAAATPGYARAALAHCREAARVLAEEPEPSR